MAKILIVGGGFGGVVVAESLARKLEREHQIVLVSRSRKFLFYPALVRLAFGRGEPDDVSFDQREAMLDRRVTFIEGEIARIHPGERHVTKRTLLWVKRSVKQWNLAVSSSCQTFPSNASRPTA